MKAINARTGNGYNDALPYQVKNGTEWYEFNNFDSMYDYLIKEGKVNFIRYKGANIRMLLTRYIGSDRRNTGDFVFDNLGRNIETRVNRYGVYE